MLIFPNADCGGTVIIMDYAPSAWQTMLRAATQIGGRASPQKLSKLAGRISERRTAPSIVHDLVTLKKSTRGNPRKEAANPGKPGARTRRVIQQGANLAIIRSRERPVPLGRRPRGK